MKNDVLSKNIRIYRKKNDLTQAGLAARLYITPQTVSKWESGISEPDTEKLCALADAFGISLDLLVRSQVNDAKKALIAIDGGGTKTDFLLFSEDGEVLDRLILGGSNPNAYGLEQTKSVLSEGIDRFSRSSEIIGIFAGISGASAGNNRHELCEFLKKRYPYAKSRVEGDIHNVIFGVKGAPERCIAAICGTGSVVYGYDGKDLLRYGGWGYLFDNAGSGFDIGRDALRHALMAEEGECPESHLSRAVSEKAGGKIFDNIGDIYAKGKDYIASFAPTVIDLAASGDGDALAIVKRTTDRLASLINRAADTHRFGNLVVIAGGLSVRRDVIEPLLREKINEKLKIVFAGRAPIVGAAVKCVKLYCDEADLDAVREKVEKEIFEKWTVS
ncbi:MAG: helix-turn-helix domain-containing protein [Ruminococcaceae bacterium]|nr:helix-turn-helix domain-containing protein [Oscillospiraceae bacterium]